MPEQMEPGRTPWTLKMGSFWKFGGFNFEFWVNFSFFPHCWHGVSSYLAVYDPGKISRHPFVDVGELPFARMIYLLIL